MFKDFGKFLVMERYTLNLYEQFLFYKNYIIIDGSIAFYAARIVSTSLIKYCENSKAYT